MVRYEVALRSLAKLVLDIATPVQVTSESASFVKATFVGVKAPRTNNTGTVYLGFASGNDTQFIPIATGASLTIEAPPSQAYNFNQFWLDAATVGDGVIIYYS